jgi:hypothetical protein
VANPTTGLATASGVVDAALFSQLVGDQHPDPHALASLEAAELRFAELDAAAHAAALARAAATNQTELRASGPHRADDWERGWAENLHLLTAGAPDALVPKYNRHAVLRLAGRYVQALTPQFEYQLYTALRHHWCGRWFAGLTHVVEFGCGTGTSLELLAARFPGLQLLGLDWASSSQHILAQLAARTGARIEGRRFDMFHPDPTLQLPEGTGVFTSAALEQLGPDHGPLLDHVLRQKPAVVVHLEPIVEGYDPAEPFDAVARDYHLRRNYLRGYLPALQRLEAQRRIELLAVQRSGFGSFHHEGYTAVVWRPRRGGSA